MSVKLNLVRPPLTPQAASAFNTATNRLTTGSYDAAGNQTVFSNFTAAYDAENRQTTVTDGTSGNQMTYRYDGNGQRVIKGNTVYVYDAFGLLVAQYNNFPVSSVTCTTCYLSADHLGSTRLVTDGSANVVARHDHMPFGEELSSGVSGRTAQWDGQDGVTQKFTGEERDAETGLDFFQARYYSSAIGRFMSPDPANAGADPSNPQSWNGYAYVLDSPLIGVDPDGTDPYQGSGDDPCDGDPYCGWGDPWFPIGFPSDPGPSQPPPPPYTPPMTPIPNTTGVYGQDSGIPVPYGMPLLCSPPAPCTVDPSVWARIGAGIGNAASPWLLVLAYLLHPPGNMHSEAVFLSATDDFYKRRRAIRAFYAESLSAAETQDCDQEWKIAIEACTEELSQPSYKVRGRMFGSTNDIFDCARGRVPKRCGGHF